MEKKRVIGLSLFIIGIGIFFFNPLGILTGFAIAEDIPFSSSWALYFAGLVLMMVGLVIGGSLDDKFDYPTIKSIVKNLRKRGKPANNVAGMIEDYKTRVLPKDYYKRRVEELFDLAKDKGSGYRPDAWVQRWEIYGIMDYIKNAKNSEGIPIYSSLDFEHSTNQITKDMDSGEKYHQPHVNFRFYKGERPMRAHLFVTDEPNDKRIKSGVYDSKIIPQIDYPTWIRTMEKNDRVTNERRKKK